MADYLSQVDDLDEALEFWQKTYQFVCQLNNYIDNQRIVFIGPE